MRLRLDPLSPSGVSVINEQTASRQSPGYVTDKITGLLTAGTNVTLTGSGTRSDPYSIASSGTGGGGGTGTVTSVSSADANATVATGTTTPVITVVSAPKLLTARTISGVSFDGSANITLTQDNIGSGTTNKAYTVTEQTKLAGIATGATANSSDATLLARANHTGTQLASTISDFSTAADARISAAAGVSVASLSGGKVPSSQIPAIGLVSVQTAASQAAQLALTTQEGDVVVRTDTNVTYMRNAGVTGTMTDFTLLNTPTAPVTSVNSQTGVVVLGKTDVGLGNVDNTSDVNKPVSIAQATSIATKAPALSPTAVKTSAYTLAANEFVPVDTTSGAVTLTLPSAPANGTRFGAKIVILGTGNTVTITSGGTDVFNKVGGNTSVTLTLLNQGIQYQYFNGIWYGIAGDIGLTALDARYQATLSLTTTGTSGAATLTGSTLNIPQYTGGGGGSPGGSTTQMQYNNSGSFAGSDAITVQSGFANLKEVVSGSAPSAPTSGTTLYSLKKAGRNMLSQVGPSGLSYSFQPNLGTNRIRRWFPTGNGTVVINDGFTATLLGTATNRTMNNVGTFYESVNKIGYMAAATASTSSGFRNTQTQFFIGPSTGWGGFYLVTRFGFTTIDANMRVFAGFTAGTGDITADYSSQTNIIGIGKDAADTNFQWMTNDATGTATKVDLGSNFAPQANKLYEVRIFTPPNGSTIYYSLHLMEPSGTSFLTEGSSTTDIPANTLRISPRVSHNTGTNAVASGIDIISIYVETDF